MKNERVNDFRSLDRIYTAPDKGTVKDIKRGEIYYIDKEPVFGSEQQGGRPGIVVSNNTGNKASDIIQVIYITTQPKNDLPTHVTIYSAKQISTALCEQIWPVSQARVGDYVGKVTDNEMSKVEKAIAIGLGLKLRVGNQVIGIESNGDDVLELASKHVKEIMELAERRKKAVEVFNSITDSTNVCLYQPGGMTQFNDLISEESMEQIRQSTVQAICNAKEYIAKQIKEKIGVKERKAAVINQDFETAVTEMEEQHSKSLIVEATEKLEQLTDKEFDTLLKDSGIDKCPLEMTVENVKELFWDKDYTIEKTAEVLGVKRSTLYNFICKHNLKKPKKEKPTKSGVK